MIAAAEGIHSCGRAHPGCRDRGKPTWGTATGVNSYSRHCDFFQANERVLRVASDEARYVPSSSESEQLAVVHDFITEHELAGNGSIAPRYFLAGTRAGGH